MANDYSFPKKDDLIFEGLSDNYWIYNACLLPGNPTGYRTGFKIAADVIAKRIAKDQKDIDRIIYPLVYLYRHYIELSLKDAIVNSKIYLDEEIILKEISGHSLVKLWEISKPLLKKIDKSYLTEEMEDAIIHYVNIFSELDPRSTSFRYPWSKEGEVVLKKQNINIKVLYEAMQKLENFFEILILDLIEKNRTKDEYIS